MNLMVLRRVAAVVALSCSVLVLTSCWRAGRVITRNKSAPAQALLTADKHDLLKLIEKQYQPSILERHRRHGSRGGQRHQGQDH